MRLIKRLGKRREEQIFSLRYPSCLILAFSLTVCGLCAQQGTTEPVEDVRLTPSLDLRLSFAEANAPTLGLEQCVQQGLVNNPRILRAQEEIKRLYGVEIEVRAEALPQVVAAGSFQAEEDSRLEAPGGIDFFPTFPGSTGGGGGNDQQTTTWQVGLQVNQLVYAGGRVKGAVELAQLSQKKAILDLQAAIADVIFDIQRIFYNVLLNRALIYVNEESVKLRQLELENQQRRFRAGTVTRFNVLRAEVELANAQPDLIRSRNALRVSFSELAQLLGVEAQPEKADTLPFDIQGEFRVPGKKPAFEEAMIQAFMFRPELQSRQKQIEIEKKQLRVDFAGYLPALSIFGGYDVTGTRFSEFGDNTSGFVGGVQGEWNLFDGLATQGKMKATRARMHQAEIDRDDFRRQIVLEIRKAYSRLIEAIELIESQKKNVESAKESLRLAVARFDAGVGIQIDTINSQVALTEAQTNQLQARYDYSVAFAELERAIGMSTQWIKKNEQGLPLNSSPFSFSK